MKSIEEVIAHLETELAEAQEMYDHSKRHDKQAALLHLIKAATIKGILEEIRR